MSLTTEEKDLIADHVADFAMRIVLQGISPNEKEMFDELTRFHSFFCRALEAAKRDARREALTTTYN
jgi:hypothetical protein